MNETVKLTGPKASIGDLLAELGTLDGITVGDVAREPIPRRAFGRPGQRDQFELVDLVISFGVSLGANLTYDIARSVLLSAAHKHRFRNTDNDKSEPFRKDVESDESVVIRLSVLIRRALHVEAGTSFGCGSSWASLPQ